jgi:hypothetical protein
MSTNVGLAGTLAEPRTETAPVTSSPARQAFNILRLGFTVAPIVAGIDKFTNLLTDWDKYLPPFVNTLTGGNGHALMLMVGVIEVAAGIGVALKPRLFASVVAAWLGLIIINLLMVPGYLDVALRDLGLALGALALARLSKTFDPAPARIDAPQGRSRHA